MLWAIRSLKYENTDPLWLHIVNSLLPDGITFTYLLKTRPTRKTLEDVCPNLPQIYKEIVLNWEKITSNVQTDRKEKILKECLWLNNRINVKGKPLYCNQSMKKGILYISDIYTPEGNMLDHIELNRRFRTNMTFLDLLRIRLTLPHQWKEMLMNNTSEKIEPDLLNNRLTNLNKLKTKDLYVYLLEKEHDCNSPPNPQIYWQKKYEITEETMKLAYILPYKVTKLTILQALQYKILNKIINCNFWLNKIQIIDSPKCRFCQKEDTIEHVFLIAY
jgi:hypothetical protein